MTKTEKQHKAALVELGCMACRRIYGPHSPGPVELHHRRSGGWGKGSFMTLIPLCHNHHQGAEGIHTYGVKAWERKNGFTQQDLLDDALQLLGVTA